MEKHIRTPRTRIDQAELKHYFLSHLNRIFCAKNELVDKLPELANRSYFLDLRQAINETIEIVSLQIARMKTIYVTMDAFYQPESCVGLIGILDEAFQAIGLPEDSPAIRDLSVLFYMQNIESIEAASFKTMLLVAHKLNQPEVEQLILERYDEAREDKVLFKEIMQKYL